MLRLAKMFVKLTCPIANVVLDAFCSSLSFIVYVNLCSNVVEMLACRRQFLILNGESTPTQIRVVYTIGVGGVGSAKNTCKHFNSVIFISRIHARNKCIRLHARKLKHSKYLKYVKYYYVPYNVVCNTRKTNLTM